MMQSWGRFSFILALVALASPMSRAQMTTPEWEEDLDALATVLPEKHPDFFTKHTAEEFDGAIVALRQRLGELDDQQIVMELSRLVAMGGDAHTTLDLGAYAEPMRRMPIQVAVLDDGVFVTAADEPVKDLIGARVVSVHGVDAMEAIERVSVLFAYENRSRKIATGARYVTLLPALAAVGMIDAFNADSIDIMIEQRPGGDGSAALPDAAPAEKEVILDCTLPFAGYQWVSFVQRLPEPLPLAYRTSRGYYQSEFIDAFKTMYVAYNRCGEAPDLPMKDFVSFVMGKCGELDARRIIIDLRFNGGGDETVIWPLWKALGSSERFKDKGDIIGLISRRTFSSAMSNSHQLRDWTDAVLMGEPTGGKPNHFGQVSGFPLPHSKLVVHHSTKWFQKVEGDPEAVVPDVEIPVTSADLFGGRDPVIEAALEYTPEPE